LLGRGEDDNQEMVRGSLSEVLFKNITDADHRTQQLRELAHLLMPLKLVDLQREINTHIPLARLLRPVAVDAHDERLAMPDADLKIERPVDALVASFDAHPAREPEGFDGHDDAVGDCGCCGVHTNSMPCIWLDANHLHDISGFVVIGRSDKILSTVIGLYIIGTDKPPTPCQGFAKGELSFAAYAAFESGVNSITRGR